MITIEESSATPLYRQIYERVREGILAGRFRPGERLPSTRVLAASLDVARITVEQGYEQLAAEGYLESRPGSGRYVAQPLPDDLLTAEATRTDAAPAGGGGARPSSAWAARLLQGVFGLDDPYAAAGGTFRYDFKPGVPSLEAFPASLWRRLLARQWRREEAALLAYGDAAGHAPLREAIASYLRRARGVRCTAEQVVVTGGTTQAVDLLTRLTVDVGDAAVVEDPGFPGARALLSACGASILPIRVDRQGLCVEALPPPRSDGEPRRPAPVRLVYVTPSHQYPLGGTMPLPRRLALLHWAAAAGAIVVEDDYDSEFRYSGRPVTALQGLDTEGIVVYIGTFSKVLSPGLRIGYVVLPPQLLRPFIMAKRLADRHTPALEQRALAAFMLEGHFERHLRRLRTLYRQRQGILIEALRNEFGDRCTVQPAAAGMHLVVRLAPGLEEERIARAAAAASVGVYPLGRFQPQTAHGPTLLMGYTGLTEEELRDGVRLLGRVIRRAA